VACWTKNGSLVAEMNESDAGLLIVEKNKNVWTGKIIKSE
jgi:hypothetical protein